MDEVMSILRTGSMNRTTASTLMNDTSSRSHAVFTITVESTPKDVVDSDIDPEVIPEEDSRPKFVSKLTFVDLAGSERLKRTQVTITRVPSLCWPAYACLYGGVVAT